MARIKEFAGLRPDKKIASFVAELPYDVVTSEEAREIAQKNQYSFFHISKPEVDLSADVSLYDDSVYATGRKNLERFIGEGILKKEESPCLYLYTQVMDGREQTGIVTCLHIDDYLSDTIKKHELTREDKEIDRMKHLDSLNAQAGLVFTFYKEDGRGAGLFAEAIMNPPEYDFTTADGIRHVFRIIRDSRLIEEFKRCLDPLPLYIADGHHRAASAVKVGLQRRAADAAPADEKEYNWFMAVVFPHNQLKIMAYNRVVRDLNGRTPEEFLQRLWNDFDIRKHDSGAPSKRHTVCMYLEGHWYEMTPRFEIPADPIKSLDVSIVQDVILGPVLGITDPRRDTRIDFVGGVGGIDGLCSRVDSGEFKVAFSLYPTSIEELMAVADEGGLMPPKSTWFEPKLRSGLVLHQLP